MALLFSLLAACMMSTGQMDAAFAATPAAAAASNNGSQTYTVSATIPDAAGVGITAQSINASTNAATPVSGTSLSFDPMTFNSATSTYLPDHYFAIDVGPAGAGAGTPDVTVSYTEGANPNTATGHGLGWKSTATFVKKTPTGETPLSAHGPKKMLKDLTSEHVTSSELGGGAFRMYVGIVSKDPAAAIPDPAASEIFSNADAPGVYSGSLLISATVV